ncbi:helix-turn-helix transcriptional regulator [Rouxiella badensis]|uniref:XRE family transcriptional regulator n=1 Tax=Rouxiella badensis TaxID=1646377 RepID=UPI0013EF3F12|nr:helix-turn-helix transcriptional regulator [Rouxiella badensis]QII37488.1 helix-turn-helix transcriptional regulator [Rouxiella badensis]
MSLDSLSDRLKLAMYEAGHTQSSLALRVGVSQGAIQKLVSGKASSSRNLVEISKALGVNAEWLNSGAGPMKNDYRPSYLKHEKTNLDEIISDSRVNSLDEVEVPFLKDIEFACGDGSLSDTDYNGLILKFTKSLLRKGGANSDGKGVLCFPARGNSMEPMIPDGSTVAINCNDKRIVDGKVYAISQDGWKRLKMVHRASPDQVTLRSYNNTEYPDEIVSMKDVEIIGRMFWISIIF